MLHGSLEQVQYKLFNEFGELYDCKGGYLLVDGGFVNSIVLIEPEKFRMDRDSVLFSEWLESVRKDVECFFGILKNRWWWFRNGICYHSTQILGDAFKTVCTLNNMILMFDQSSGRFDNGWETVHWEQLDPDADDITDLEDIRELPSIPDLEPLSLEDVNQDQFNKTVTEFTVKMPRPILKEALKKSFVVQWIKQKLQWPKNSHDSQKSRMPLVRATIEMKRALYKAPSTLLTKNNASLNYGLFSKLGYRKDETIAHFIGIERSVTQWTEICLAEPHKRAYGLISSENGVILDCYDSYTSGLCLASAANSPSGCVHYITKAPAVANCRLICPPVKKGSRKNFYLKAGVTVPETSEDNFFIPPNTELLWDYGDSYVNYLN